MAVLGGKTEIRYKGIILLQAWARGLISSFSRNFYGMFDIFMGVPFPSAQESWTKTM